MHRIHDLIAESAEKWRLSTRVAAWIFWIPLIGAAAMALARLHKDTFKLFLREDGILEWGQFVCFVVACLAGAAVARCRLRAGHPWQAAAFAIFALGMLFAAGEEVSWGQRILGLETPEYFRSINKQNEIGLHNVGPTLGVIKLVMLAGSFLAASAWLVNGKLRVQRFADRADYLFIPPFFLSSSFLVVFAYQLARHTVWPASGFTVTRYGEWSESCLAFGLAAFAVLNYWLLAADARQREAA